MRLKSNLLNLKLSANSNQAAIWNTTSSRFSEINTQDSGLEWDDVYSPWSGTSCLDKNRPIGPHLQNHNSGPARLKSINVLHFRNRTTFLPSCRLSQVRRLALGRPSCLCLQRYVRRRKNIHNTWIRKLLTSSTLLFLIADCYMSWHTSAVSALPPLLQSYCKATNMGLPVCLSSFSSLSGFGILAFLII